jgi:trimeric autotransporter adhesin
MPLTATDLFNDATTREIGGVGPDQVNLIVSDLIGVQQMLSAADPQINNLTDLHTHVIINQLNEEIAAVENANSPAGTSILGTDLGQFVGRAINDIHRDIIDIAQGDQGVQALFNPTPLPPLNTPAAPFLDNAAQTAFVTQWIQDSNHLGQAAITIENNGFTGDIAGLVQQIQAFENNSNAFDQSQGGLWSARFWNEFRSDGTAGTAANALIEGLQTHNAGEVNAAAEQLAANSADVGGNNLKADGGSYADVVAAAQATAVTPAGGSQAAGDQGGNTSGNQAAGDQGGNTGGNQAAGDQGGNTSGNQAARDQGGNTGDHGGNTSGNQAAGDHGGSTGGNQAGGDHGGTAGGNQATADHGANSLVADLTALFEGGGQNSVSAVLADISALAHGAGVHGNGVATLLADLLTGAGASAQSGGGAPAASADSGHGDPSPAVVQHAGFEHMWHHG